MDDIDLTLWCFILVIYLVFFLKELLKIENSIRHPPSPSSPSSLDAPPSYTVVMEAEEEALPSYAQVMGEVEEVEGKVTEEVEGASSPFTQQFEVA